MTTGMRVFFPEGSDVVEDISIFYGGMGATTVGAPRTCSVMMRRSVGESGEEPHATRS